MFRFLPEQASEAAANIDWIHNIITDLSVFFTVVIVGAMIYFAIRYRERPNARHETPQIRGSHFLEIVWTVVPTVISVYIAYYGIVYYQALRVVPDNALTINVRAQKWQWDFEYDNGKRSVAEFVVPVNQPVKLVMRSRDVLHSFFIPAMRVKADVIPNRYTYVAFTPIKTGEYQTFCTEYCGDNHSQMLAKVKVVSEDEYARWVNDRGAELLKARQKPSDRGRALYEQKGCKGCHSLNGMRIIGPSFLKLYGKEEEVEGGAKVKVDENYLTESILYANAKIAKGYQANLMPSFKGQLSDDDVADLIAFIKTIDGTNPEAVAMTAAPAAGAAAAGPDLTKMTPAERGKHWYETKLCMTCHSIDGSRLVGPTFKGLYGSPQKLTDGTTAVADDAYLKHSIQEPMAQIVEGYAPSMPAGLLDEKQIGDVVEYIKTLK